MIILASFQNSGAPALGLIPTIRIRLVSDGSLVITDLAMTEIGDGVYKYDFAAYDDTIDYSIRCEGTSALSDGDRYVFIANETVSTDPTSRGDSKADISTLATAASIVALPDAILDEVT